MKATYLILSAAGILIALIVLVLSSPGAKAWQSGDSYSGSGDWSINNPTVVADDSITVTGNIEINSNLEVYNSQIYIASDYDNEYYVDVSSSGSLYLWDASTLTASNNGAHYSFTDHGTFDINESTVSEMWGDTNSWTGGIQLYSSGANIRNSEINNGETGGIYISNVSASITYNNIHDNGAAGSSTQYCYGIYVYSDGTTSTDISYNNIYDNQYSESSWWYYGYGIYSAGQSSSDTITNNDIYDNGFSMWANSQGYQLYLSSSGPTITDNQLTHGEYGLYASGSSPPTISGGIITSYAYYYGQVYGAYATGSSLSFDSVTFTCDQFWNTVYGIYGESNSMINVTSCTFNYLAYGYYNRYFIYSDGNTQINVAACTFDDQYGSSVYGIYANSYSPVNVTDIDFQATYTSYTYGVYASSYCPVNITGSTFTNTYGYFYGVYVSSYCPVNITGNTFNNNYGYFWGIYGSSYSPLNITESTFNNNYGYVFYGVSASSYCPVNITDSTFTINYNYGGFYGLSASSYCPVNITGSTFTDYYGYFYGISASSYCPVNIIDSTFNNYYDTFYGIQTSWYCTINISGSTFTNNYNYGYFYGVYASYYCTVDIVESTFTDIYGYFYGVYAYSYTPVNITTTRFSSMYTSYSYPVQVYSTSPLNMEACSIDISQSNGDMHVIDASDSSNVTVNDTSWNIVGCSGGWNMYAIRCSGNSPATISNLTATFDGLGGYYWYGFNMQQTALAIYDSTITDINNHVMYYYNMFDMNYNCGDLVLQNVTVDVDELGGGYQWANTYFVQGYTSQSGSQFRADRLNATMSVHSGYCYPVQWGYGTIELDNSTLDLSIMNCYYLNAVFYTYYSEMNLYNDTFLFSVEGLQAQQRSTIFYTYSWGTENDFRMDRCLLDITTISTGRTMSEVDVFYQMSNMNIYITNSTILTRNIGGFYTIDVFNIYSALLLDVENTTFDSDYGHGSSTNAPEFQWGWFYNMPLINFTDSTIDIALVDEPMVLDTFFFQQACGELDLVGTRVNWDIDAPGCTAGMFIMSTDPNNGGSLESLLLQNSKLTMTVNEPDGSLSLLGVTSQTNIGDFKIVDSEVDVDCRVASSIPVYAIQISGSDLLISGLLLDLNAPASTDAMVVGISVEGASPVLNNITIQGNGNGRIYGILSTQAASPTIKGCTINNTYIGIAGDFFSMPAVSETTIGNCSIGVQLYNISNATLSSTDVKAGVGIEAAGSSWASLYGCTVQGSSNDFELNGSSTVWLLDSSFNGANGALFQDEGSQLIVNWQLQLKTMWQNGKVIAGADIHLRNSQGLDVMQAQTNTDGIVPYSIVVEYMQNGTAKTSFSPYMVNVTYGGLSGEQSVIVDRTKQENITITDYATPTLTVSKPADGLIQNFQTVVVSGTASDIGSGIDLLNITYDGINFEVIPATSEWVQTVDIPEGTWQLTVRLTDVSGNSVTVVSTITIDLTRPFIDVESPQNDSLGNIIDMILTGAVEPGSSLSVDQLPVTVAPDGKFSHSIHLVEGRNDFFLFARDRAGNVNFTSWTLYLDITPPVLTLSSPRDGLLTNQSSVLVSGKTEPGAIVSVNGQPIAVQPDGSFSMVLNLTAGPNLISVEATDRANNTARGLRNVVLDNQIRLDIIAPADKLVTNQVTILFQGVTDIDALLKLNEAIVTIEPDGNFSVTYTLTEGWNTLEFSATDRAGNTRSITRTVMLDTIPPTLEVSSPVQNAMLRTTDVVVAGLCEPGITLTVNGAPISTETGIFNITLTLPEGASSIHIAAFDAAGNTVTYDIPVTVDLTPPSLELVEPLDGLRTNELTIDIIGITEPGATVTVNGIPVVVDSFGKFTAQLTLTKGKNRITAISTDAAGNSNSKNLTVNVVSPPPAVEASTWWWVAVGLLLALGVMMPLLIYLANSWFNFRIKREGSK